MYARPLDPYRSLMHDDPKRLAYTIEVNPWVPDQFLKDAILFRGAIISAWGYIETKLTELAICSSRMVEYAALSDSYPYKLDNRMNYMRRVLASEGPFSQYREIGQKFLDRFDEAAELRHQMAHSHMQGLPDWGITFTDYVTIANGAITQRRQRMSLKELEHEARRSTRLSKLMQKGYSHIRNQNFLPSLHET